MSVVVKDLGGHREEPALERPGAIRVVGALVRFLSRALAAVAAVCVVGAFVSGLLNDSPYGVVLFVEWSLGACAYAVIAGCLGRLLDVREESPFSAAQGRCLRVAAGGFFALALTGLLASLLASYLASGSVPLVNIAFPGAGFPDALTWERALSGSVQPPNSNIASVDMASVVAGLVLWAASYLFDYGTRLQREKEGTV